MMTLLIVAVVLVGLAVLGLAIGILLKKDGKFPELHIGRNEKLKEKGITCATSQDKLAQQGK